MPPPPGNIIDQALTAIDALGMGLGPVHPGDRVSIGGQEHTVVSVRGTQLVIASESQMEQRIAAHYTPGGAALQYNASTRIRMQARPRREPSEADRVFNTRFMMRKTESANAKERMVRDLLDGKTSFTAILDDTQIHIDAIRDAMERAQKAKPQYRSVWWWLRNPVV